MTATTVYPPHIVTTTLGCLYNLVSGNRSAKERLLLYPNIPQLLIEVLDQTRAALFWSHNEERKNGVRIAAGGAAVRGDGEVGRDQVGEDRVHSEVLRCLLCIRYVPYIAYVPYMSCMPLTARCCAACCASGVFHKIVALDGRQW